MHKCVQPLAFYKSSENWWQIDYTHKHTTSPKRSHTHLRRRPVNHSFRFDQPQELRPSPHVIAITLRSQTTSIRNDVEASLPLSLDTTPSPRQTTDTPRASKSRMIHLCSIFGYYRMRPRGSRIAGKSGAVEGGDGDTRISPDKNDSSVLRR